MKIHAAAALFPLLSEDDLQVLAADIKINGLHQPIATYGGVILDGRNRLEACRRAAVEPRFTEWDGNGSPTAYVISANLLRRQLTKSQAAAVAVDALPLFEEEAKERQRHSKGRGQKGSALVREVKRKSSNEAAGVFGVSPRYIETAKQLKEHSDVIFEQVKSGEKTLTEASREIARERCRQHAAMAPSGKYRVLYADPPWKYGDSRDGLEGTTGATAHYPTMSISELCALPVSDWTDDNAVLFLWVTSPLLFECLPVIKSWGFQYKASFVWDKIKHNIGHYNSVRHEFLLLCTRGSCVPDASKLFDSVQSIERKAHSEKPEEFRQMINFLYPNGRRLELFARKSVKGWDAYGNESNDTVLRKTA